jgi:hypothetical protein
MDSDEASGSRRIPRFDDLFEGLEAVEETVENLCCIEGKQWKTTRM